MPAAASAADLKRAKHFEAADASNDEVFNALLAAAQSVVETACNRPLTPRDVELDVIFEGGTRWWFPCCPVSSVSDVVWFDGGGWRDVPRDGWRLVRGSSEPQLLFLGGAQSIIPSGAEMRITATVGEQAVPKGLWQAIILLAGDWFEAGINPEKPEFQKVVFGAKALIRQGRYRRPTVWGRS
jgi:uncharacterized phiE125 gp8 family phage protein